MWRTKYSVYLLIISIFSGVVFTFSCGSNDEEDEEETDTVITTEVKPFSVANYNFAILQDKKFIPYNKAIYHRGDEVYLVLENVGPFEPGIDSMNRAEMKLLVTNAIGQKIVYRDSILGERGHKKFLNNTLASPYGSFTTGQNEKPGKYTICVTIYDLVQMDSVVVCDDFFIE